MIKKPQQKLISFTAHDSDFSKIEKELKEGWSIVSLTSTGNNYIGIIERSNNSDDMGIHIPARKKIKFI